MRISIVVIITLVFLVLQVVALRKLSIGDISPDLALILCALLALYRGKTGGAVIGFFIGFFQDLFNPSLLGLNALTKTLIGFGFGHMGTKILPEKAQFLASIFFLAAVAHDFVYLIFFTALDIGLLMKMFLTIALPSAIYTALIGVLAHKLFLLLNSRVVRSFGKERRTG